MTATIDPNVDAAPRKRTDVLEAVTAIWSEVVGVPVSKVTRSDSFFSKGDSFAAVVFCARMEETFGVEMPLTTLIDAPTFDAIVDWLCDASRTSSENPAATRPSRR